VTLRDLVDMRRLEEKHKLLVLVMVGGGGEGEPPLADGGALEEV